MLRSRTFIYTQDKVLRCKRKKVHIQYLAMEICPVNREWVHSHLVEPFSQGARLMNRAWQGVDFEHLNRPSLSLKERGVSLITGLVLMTPLVNIVVWLAWQTFGKPPSPIEPFNPEPEPPPRPALPLVHQQPPAAQVPAAPAAQAAPIVPAQVGGRQPDFSYEEVAENGPIRSHWTLEYLDDRIVIRQKLENQSTTFSIYSPDWKVQEFHYQSDERILDIWLEGGGVKVSLVKTGESPMIKKLPFTERLTWIQQPTIGFKNFVLSPEKELLFYGVVPENPSLNPFAPKSPILMKAIAKKVGEEEVPGFGKLLKVEVASQWGFPYNQVKGELWFDPPNGAVPGMLRKFTDPGFIKKKTGEFVLGNQLPELERQQFLARWLHGQHP